MSFCCPVKSASPQSDVVSERHVYTEATISAHALPHPIEVQGDRENLQAASTFSVPGHRDRSFASSSRRRCIALSQNTCRSGSCPVLHLPGWQFTFFFYFFFFDFFLSFFFSLHQMGKSPRTRLINEQSARRSAEWAKSCAFCLRTLYRSRFISLSCPSICHLCWSRPQPQTDFCAPSESTRCRHSHMSTRCIVTTKVMPAAQIEAVELA